MELLIVVFMIGLLATMAISSYTNSTENFSYIGAYKDMMSSLRTARSYAITNKEEAGVVPDRYGVCLSEKGVVLFTDTGDKDFSFDPKSGQGVDDCVVAANGELNKDAKFDEVITSQAFDKYTISAQDSIKKVLALPILVFYARGGGDVSVIKADGTPVPLSEKSLAFVFAYPAKELKKYTKLFLISGLAEEYDTLE